MIYILSIVMIITYMVNGSDSPSAHSNAPQWEWLKHDPKLKQKIASHLFEKTKDIQKIKSFYQEAQHSYNEPYYAERCYEQEHAKYPLSWALKKDLDFALWLVKDQRVDTSYLSEYGTSYLHRLAKVMKNDGPLGQYAELIKIFAENEGVMNHLDDFYSNSSLMTYMNAQQDYNLEIIKLFFAYGAHIVDHEGQHLYAQGKAFEGIHSLLSHSKKGPHIIPYLFKIKLDAQSALTGVNYRNNLSYAKAKYDTCYRLLSLWSKQSLKGSLPQFFIHRACTLAVSEHENRNEVNFTRTKVRGFFKE